MPPTPDITRRSSLRGEPDSSDIVALRGIDPDITVLRDWAPRIALVVGQALHPAIVSVLRTLQFHPVVVSPDQAVSVVRSLGPTGFFLLGADVFADDHSVEAVQAWHRASPSARVKLVCPAERRDPDVLLRALRAGVTDVLDPDDRDACETSLRRGMTAAGAARERVLAIGAHPDDVEIGCGGTLLDHRMRGDRISILTLSRGAIGGDTQQRVTESGATADALGAQLLFADLPDTEIDDGVRTIRLIESVIQRLDPTVVYVHSAHDNHQDHRAVSTAVRSAARGVRRVFAYQSPSATNDFLPTQFVNIDETVRRKVELLALFRSQDGRSYLEPELVTAGARYWARHLAASARYAEPFEVVRSVGELRHSVTSPVFEEASQPTQELTVSPVALHAVPPVIASDDNGPALDALKASAGAPRTDPTTSTSGELAGAS